MFRTKHLSHGLLAITGLIMLPAAAEARDQIHAVGSSTVYPFTTAAAEVFGQNGHKTPIVENIGTGAGFKLFCAGTGDDTPDINDASRPITESEKELCKKNGVTDITELTIGYDGIVIANSVKGPKYSLTKKDVFTALARQLPGKDGKMIANPYTKWSEINPSLPDIQIEVYGRPPTSGTRDAFAELVMEKGCEAYPEFKTAYPDDKDRKNACRSLREDGRFVEVPENNMILQKLAANPNALGTIGYSYLEENSGKVQGSTIEGVEPNFKNIVDNKYSVSRSLFIYVKNAHLKTISGLAEFALEMTSNGAIGKDGYLVQRGLLPLPEKQRKESQQAAMGLISAAR